MSDTKSLHEKFIRLTFKLAENGRGYTGLNPIVGCVIVKNNNIISTGYHRYFGGPHAEINALEKIKYQAKDATLYVNLEPCCHYGKTPPCTSAIIKSGIKEVVASISDPNPLVNGRGFKTLKNNGIKVTVGLLSSQAKFLNRAYFKYMVTKLPYCVIKTALSFDGKIATHSGDSKWITSEEARNYVYNMRSKMDAIIVGVNTIIKDNPTLTSHGYGKNPVRVIIDPHLLIPKKSQVLRNEGETIIVTTEEAFKQRNLKIKSNVKFIIFKKNLKKYFEFKKILTELTKYNISNVLIEGGGTTNALALKSGVVDEILFFYAPIIIGGKNAITPVEGEGVKYIHQSLKIKYYKISKIGQDVLIHAYLNSEFIPS